jgi:hypothetical protein
VDLGFGTAINDADIVLESVVNFFCGSSFPASDPALIQKNTNTYSFLPLGGLGEAAGTAINNIGDVLGCAPCGSGGHLVDWDGNGVHDLGPSGSGYLNQVGQIVYLGPPTGGASSWESGSFYLWQNGVSTPIEVPAGLFPVDDFPAPVFLNDAGQFVAGDGTNFYLLSPSGACAKDVTSEFTITRTGFRYDHSTGLFALIGSVTNTSGSPIAGPISLVVDDLPAGASLYGISGDTLCAAPQGSPFIDIGNIGRGQVWPPGASVSGSIDFIDTSQTGISYRLRVLAGPGAR